MKYLHTPPIETPMDAETFEKMAATAAAEDSLVNRETEHGKAYRILLNGFIMASSTPTADGERLYFSHY